jgi:glycosyltransferase involved in cell wall biosynthesis
MSQTRAPLHVGMVHYSDFHVDSRLQRQARALAARGDQLDLVCLSENGTIRVGDGVIRLHHVPVTKAAAGVGAYLRSYGAFCAAALLRVTALDRHRRFDLVEVHNMPDFLTFSAIGPRLRGVPVILNVHDTFPELFATRFSRSEGHPAVRVLRAEERLSAALADAVITVTAEAADRLSARGVGGGRPTVVMNTPDEGAFGPRRPPAGPLSGAPVRLIYHGGLAERFGVELLIRAVGAAAGRLEDVTLRVCGAGTGHAELRALAAEVAPGLVEISDGPVPFTEIPGELERADVGVVPTLPDPFTELLLPVKLLEYVHMGLPAVAPRLPVIERYFSDREVRFFEPGSLDSLADAIADVCDDREAAVLRARAAAERLDAIGWSRQQATYLALVDRLVDESRSSKRARVRSRPARSLVQDPA